MKERMPNWQAWQRRFAAALTKASLRQLAEEWAVPPELLRGLGIGWSERHRAYTFPERDHEGRTIGILRRDPRTGEKRTLRGSRRGLYFVREWRKSKGPILLPEGVSDTATLLALGLTAVGRPSCKGGVQLLAELLDDVEREIIVVGENDAKHNGQWPGRDGAKEVAEKLADALDRRVKWTLPPEGCKDVRDWLNGGDADGG